jgi:hypothetical protein
MNRWDYALVLGVLIVIAYVIYCGVQAGNALKGL